MTGLRILCWQGYEEPEITGPFADRHGIRIESRTLVSDADTSARLRRGEAKHWDVLNINNAHTRRTLYPDGLVRPLDQARFSPCLEHLLPAFSRLFRWAQGDDGALIGICQRFGAFNLVVNTRRISRELAEDQGFELANQPEHGRRFGILAYEDFNVFHVCIGAGLNPFQPMSAEQRHRFELTARAWHRDAALVSDDPVRLNRALVDGDIDFYLSGGVYTASPARLAGRGEVLAVTPRRGPIDGRGGIAFAEITSVLAGSRQPQAAEAFLEYLIEPAVAARVAMASGTCNPVAQMADPKVMARFSKRQLDAIQWESLAQDIDRCADYDLVPDGAALLDILGSARADARRPAA